MRTGEDLKRRVLSALRPQAAPETSRTQMLAIAEYARRLGGDVPGGGRFVDLAPFELRVFSQNGEDGVLAEIVRRAGAPGGFFVEFGAGYGIENSCAALADLAGWGGLFMDGGAPQVAALERKYRGNATVRTARAIVSPENVEDLFAAHDVPQEPDVLSIDVDGSDFWIWQAIEHYRPRIVTIEYNGSLEPGRRLVQPRDHGPWNGTSFFGASIDAMASLGVDKDYRLVHCDLTGNNAFFVRADLGGDYLDRDTVRRRSSNLCLAGIQHAPDHEGHRYVDLDAPSAAPSRQAHTDP